MEFLCGAPYVTPHEQPPKQPQKRTKAGLHHAKISFTEDGKRNPSTSAIQ